MAVLKFPRFVDVGIGDWRHDKKGDPHRGHPATIAFGLQGMAEFVDDFYADERDAVGEEAFPAEDVDDGSREFIPLAQGQHQADDASECGDHQKPPRHERPGVRQ